MPPKKTEDRRKYQRELMRQRRAWAKQGQGDKQATEMPGVSVAEGTPPPLVKPDNLVPSGQSPEAQPAPAIPATTKAIDRQEQKQRMNQRWQEIKAAQDVKEVKTTPQKAESPLKPLSEAEAEDLEQQINKILFDKGWLLLQLAAVNNDIIVLTRYEAAQGYPPNYPVYTKLELERCGQMGLDRWHRIHEVKKVIQAKLP